MCVLFPMNTLNSVFVREFYWKLSLWALHNICVPLPGEDHVVCEREVDSWYYFRCLGSTGRPTSACPGWGVLQSPGLIYRYGNNDVFTVRYFWDFFFFLFMSSATSLLFKITTDGDVSCLTGIQLRRQLTKYMKIDSDMSPLFRTVGRWRRNKNVLDGH